jgi:hypothetical protein
MKKILKYLLFFIVFICFAILALRLYFSDDRLKVIITNYLASRLGADVKIAKLSVGISRIDICGFEIFAKRNSKIIRDLSSYLGYDFEIAGMVGITGIDLRSLHVLTDVSVGISGVNIHGLKIFAKTISNDITFSGNNIKIIPKFFVGSGGFVSFNIAIDSPRFVVPKSVVNFKYFIPNNMSSKITNSILSNLEAKVKNKGMNELRAAASSKINDTLKNIIPDSSKATDSLLNSLDDLTRSNMPKLKSVASSKINDIVGKVVPGNKGSGNSSVGVKRNASHVRLSKKNTNVNKSETNFINFSDVIINHGEILLTGKQYIKISNLNITLKNFSSKHSFNIDALFNVNDSKALLNVLLEIRIDLKNGKIDMKMMRFEKNSKNLQIEGSLSDWINYSFNIKGNLFVLYEVFRMFFNGNEFRIFDANVSCGITGSGSNFKITMH